MKEQLQQCKGFDWDKKSIPIFANEEEECAFWAKEESTNYVYWSKAKKITFSD